MTAWEQLLEEAAPRPWKFQPERNGMMEVRDADGEVIMELLGDKDADLATAELIVSLVNAHAPMRVDEAFYPPMRIEEVTEGQA